MNHSLSVDEGLERPLMGSTKAVPEDSEKSIVVGRFEPEAPDLNGLTIFGHEMRLDRRKPRLFYSEHFSNVRPFLRLWVAVAASTDRAVHASAFSDLVVCTPPREGSSPAAVPQIATYEAFVSTTMTRFLRPR
jgi:fructose-specific component phosphotransferase system IIB-like protein